MRPYLWPQTPAKHAVPVYFLQKSNSMLHKHRLTDQPFYIITVIIIDGYDR